MLEDSEPVTELELKCEIKFLAAAQAISLIACCTLPFTVSLCSWGFCLTCLCSTSCLGCLGSLGSSAHPGCLLTCVCSTDFGMLLVIMSLKSLWSSGCFLSQPLKKFSGRMVLTMLTSSWIGIPGFSDTDQKSGCGCGIYFLKRHPDLQIRCTTDLSIVCTMSGNEPTIAKWFCEYKQVLHDLGINSSEQICSLNKTYTFCPTLCIVSWCWCFGDIELNAQLCRACTLRIMDFIPVGVPAGTWGAGAGAVISLVVATVPAVKSELSRGGSSNWVDKLMSSPSLPSLSLDTAK